MILRLVVFALWASGLFAACGDSEPAPTTSPRPSSTSTSAPSTTTTVAEGPAAGGCTTLISSPARFDAEDGQYAVYLTAVDTGDRTVGFDVIQFLGGDDATRAYQREFPDESGPPPNDYYIVNENPLTRDAPVTGDVHVRIVRLDQDADADLDPGTFEELPTYLAGYRPPGGDRLSSNPFWLTFDQGVVTDICEQYIP